MPVLKLPSMVMLSPLKSNVTQAFYFQCACVQTAFNGHALAIKEQYYCAAAAVAVLLILRPFVDCVHDNLPRIWISSDVRKRRHLLFVEQLKRWCCPAIVATICVDHMCHLTVQLVEHLPNILGHFDPKNAFRR